MLLFKYPPQWLPRGRVAHSVSPDKVILNETFHQPVIWKGQAKELVLLYQAGIQVRGAIDLIVMGYTVPLLENNNKLRCRRYKSPSSALAVERKRVRVTKVLKR